ncbi:MAG: DUF2085 domain-containing protein [Blastocatellales bacterium]
MQDQIRNNQAGQSNAMKVYLALLVVSIGWLAIIFAAPILAVNGHQLSALVIYQGLSAVCHQMPDRSFHLDGLPLGVCSRCTGIYSGFIAGLVVYPLMRNLSNQQMPQRIWMILAVSPALIDFGGGFLGLFTNTFFSRTATGALLGAVAAFYILPGFVSIFSDFSTEIFLWRKLITKNLPSSAER